MGRAGRFGTKGLALTFVATDEDSEAERSRIFSTDSMRQVLKKVQERFEAVEIFQYRIL